MKPYQPYAEEAFFVETEPDMYAIKFRGVQYAATKNLTALGVLLFGLRPAGFNFRCIHDPESAVHLAQHAAYILHLHANGDRHTRSGERRISDEDLRAWIASAIGLAPDADTAAFVLKCLEQALGPWAMYSDAEMLKRRV